MLAQCQEAKLKCDTLSEQLAAAREMLRSALADWDAATWKRPMDGEWADRAKEVVK